MFSFTPHRLCVFLNHSIPPDAFSSSYPSTFTSNDVLSNRQQQRSGERSREQYWLSTWLVRPNPFTYFLISSSTSLALWLELYTMRFEGDVCEIRNVHTGRMQETAFASRIRSWWDWCGRSEIESLCKYTPTDSLLVRCFEKLGYNGRLGDILRRLESISFRIGRKIPGN